MERERGGLVVRVGLDPRILRSTDLAGVGDGSEVEVAGMVVARQRPETAKGIVFILLEGERGVVNLIVPPPVYECHRREGVVNILVSEILNLDRRVPKNPPWCGRSSTRRRGRARRER